MLNWTSPLETRALGPGHAGAAMRRALHLVRAPSVVEFGRVGSLERSGTRVGMGGMRPSCDSKVSNELPLRSAQLGSVAVEKSARRWELPERERTLEVRVIDLAEQRRLRAQRDAARRARRDATKDIADVKFHRPGPTGGSKHCVIELTADRAMYEKLLLAKLLLSTEGLEATFADVVEVALGIWLGEFGDPLRR